MTAPGPSKCFLDSLFRETGINIDGLRRNRFGEIVSTNAETPDGLHSNQYATRLLEEIEQKIDAESLTETDPWVMYS